MSFELFRLQSSAVGTVTKLPGWDFIKRGYEKNLIKAQSYYTYAGIPLKAGHPLSRIIAMNGVPLNISTSAFYKNTQAVAIHNCGSLGYCTPWINGKPQGGHFYGPGITEYYLCIDEPFDIYDMDVNYEQYNPVEVLLHPKTDMNIQYLGGNDYSSESGIAIIKINPVMLVMQIRAFILDQTANIPRENWKSPTRFIAGTTLAGAMRSHLDIALMNRLVDRFYGSDTTDQILKKHPFSQASYTQHVDRAIDSIIDIIKRTQLRFDVILRTIPAISKENQFDALQMPDVAKTKQVQWLLILARVKYWSFLVDVSLAHNPTSGAIQNRQYLQDLYRQLRRYGSLSIIESKLEASDYFEFSSYLENCLHADKANGIS